MKYNNNAGYLPLGMSAGYKAKPVVNKFTYKLRVHNCLSVITCPLKQHSSFFELIPWRWRYVCLQPKCWRRLYQWLLLISGGAPQHKLCTTPKGMVFKRPFWSENGHWFWTFCSQIRYVSPACLRWGLEFWELFDLEIRNF